MNSLAGRVLSLFGIAFVLIAPVHAVDRQFHNAPDSTKELKNPFEGQPAAVQTGKLLYARNCLSCHGKTGKGDRKSTRLNSSHQIISYAVFCLKKKNGLEMYGLF